MKNKPYLQKVRDMYSEKSVGWMFYNFLNKLNKKKAQNKLNGGKTHGK